MNFCCFFSRNSFILVYRFRTKVTDVRSFLKMHLYSLSVGLTIREFDQNLARNSRKNGTKTRKYQKRNTGTAGMSHSRLVFWYLSLGGIALLENFKLKKKH